MPIERGPYPLFENQNRIAGLSPYDASSPVRQKVGQRFSNDVVSNPMAERMARDACRRWSRGVSRRCRIFGKYRPARRGRHKRSCSVPSYIVSWTECE